VAIAALGLALAGCGSSSSAPVQPAGLLVNASATSPGQIQLTKLGEQRIGLQTSRVRRDGRSHGVVIPYSAIVYDPSGKAYAFTNTAPLTFVEVPVRIARVDGNAAYLSSGPNPGARVVAVGAEELYGVQTGVLAQT
jgi:hypothetical protein